MKYVVSLIPESGIPLGGIGTGSFEIRADGKSTSGKYSTISLDITVANHGRIVGKNVRIPMVYVSQ